MGFDKGFQSTHPSGVRQTSSTHIVNLPYFNPRTPVGCDNTGRRCSRARWHFNPRTPVGCDPGSGNHEQTHDISIHAPQWGATPVDALRHKERTDFNPRTPVGCDLSRAPCGADDNISIHAPQWGATQRVQYPLLLGLISIHAPQWGATTRTFVWAKFRRISIHAPQWGATYLRRLMRAPHRDFNPRTPVGCDSACGVDFSTADYFNPRTPVGCDSATGTVCGSPSTHFNPRTPVGCDSNQACSLGVPTNFNPRTPVGCDRQGPAEDAGPQISIHAPQWGATTTPKGKIQVVILFQSTHPSGVRLGHLSGFGTRQIISIHAPQWGATHTAAQPFAFRHISIHAPQWGATRLCRHL